MSLWSDEGLKYFRRAEKKWKEVYADNEKKQMMYGEFKNWLNMYGKNITVCCKPPRYVPYKGTYVPYDGTYGTSDQGQTLDV